MRLDTDKYMPFLEGMDLTPAQKAELLRDIWRIAESFVDLSFQGHSAEDNLQIELDGAGESDSRVVEFSKQPKIMPEHPRPPDA